MKEVFYNWLGLNEWLFKGLYTLNTPYLDGAWNVLSYAYSQWTLPFIVLAISVHYFKVRHSAPERQFEIMSELMVVLFVGFSFVWCCLYTLQNVTLYLRPWIFFPDLVTVQNPLLWHEGFPASAPAISVMVACVFWHYASSLQRKALIAYVVAGCLLSIISGINWPIDVVSGVIVGFVGVRVAQWYYRFGTTLVGKTGSRK